MNGSDYAKRVKVVGEKADVGEAEPGAGLVAHLRPEPTRAHRAVEPTMQIGFRHGPARRQRQLRIGELAPERRRRRARCQHSQCIARHSDVVVYIIPLLSIPHNARCCATTHNSMLVQTRRQRRCLQFAKSTLFYETPLLSIDVVVIAPKSFQQTKTIFYVKNKTHNT
jgi:hypothetical protein